MKRNICRRLEELERIHAATVRAEASHAAAQSGAEVIREAMLAWGVEPLGGESQADAFARALGISSRELTDRLQRRVNDRDF